MSKKISKESKILENCSIPGDDGSEEGCLVVVSGPHEDGGREEEGERSHQRGPFLQQEGRRLVNNLRIGSKLVTSSINKCRPILVHGLLRDF